MSLDELTGNDDECRNGSEIFFVDYAHATFFFLSLLSVNDMFIENHPNGVKKLQIPQKVLLKANLRQAVVILTIVFYTRTIINSKSDN